MHLGLLANPNNTDTKATTNHSNSTVKTTTVIELFDVPDSDGLCRDPNKVKQFPLSLEDERYMIKCMNRHGTDYLKMFRDIKINDMQHTEEKLRKLGSRFILLSPEQRRVPYNDIPEKVQQLLASKH
jgi:Ribosome biogenesis protein Nop16